MSSSIDERVASTDEQIRILEDEMHETCFQVSEQTFRHQVSLVREMQKSREAGKLSEAGYQELQKQHLREWRFQQDLRACQAELDDYCTDIFESRRDIEITRLEMEEVQGMLDGEMDGRMRESAMLFIEWGDMEVAKLQSEMNAQLACKRFVEGLMELNMREEGFAEAEFNENMETIIEKDGSAEDKSEGGDDMDTLVV